MQNGAVFFQVYFFGDVLTLAFKPRFNLRHENSILMYVILLVRKSKDKLEDMDGLIITLFLFITALDGP